MYVEAPDFAFIGNGYLGPVPFPFIIGHPLAGQGYELDAIASTVIGGTSVAGGEGSVVRTLIGVLLLTIIANVFNLLGVHIYIQYVIKGAIILTAVGFDAYSKGDNKNFNKFASYLLCG